LWPDSYIFTFFTDKQRKISALKELYFTLSTIFPKGLHFLNGLEGQNRRRYNTIVMSKWMSGQSDIHFVSFASTASGVSNPLKLTLNYFFGYFYFLN